MLPVEKAGVRNVLTTATGGKAIIQTDKKNRSGSAPPVGWLELRSSGLVIRVERQQRRLHLQYRSPVPIAHGLHG